MVSKVHAEVYNVALIEQEYNEIVAEHQAIEVLADPESPLAQDADYGPKQAAEIVCDIVRTDVWELPTLADAIEWYELEEAVVMEKLNEAKEKLNEALMDARSELIYYIENRLDGVEKSGKDDITKDDLEYIINKLD